MGRLPCPAYHPATLPKICVHEQEHVRLRRIHEVTDADVDVDLAQRRGIRIFTATLTLSGNSRPEVLTGVQTQSCSVGRCARQGPSTVMITMASRRLRRLASNALTLGRSRALS